MTSETTPSAHEPATIEGTETVPSGTASEALPPSDPAPPPRSRIATWATTVVIVGVLSAVVLLVATGDSPFDQAALETMTRQAEARVESVRGLKPKGPIAAELGTPDELRRFLLKAIDDKGTRDHVEVTRDVLVTLGMMRADVDLVGSLVKLMTKETAGYYDSKAKVLRVLSDSGDSGDAMLAAMRSVTVFHEVVHGVQDQHFDLEALMDLPVGMDDAALALSAVVEGDATLAMVHDMLGKPPEDEELAQFDMDALQMTGGVGGDLPKPVLEAAVFPYTGGMKLAVQAHRQGGWAAVNDLFATPPLSTEQVLHPDKLLDIPKDHPQIVTIPAEVDGALAGWKRAGTGVAGEFDYQRSFAVSLSETRAHRAAQGWDGDRWILYRAGAPGGDCVVLQVSVWDTPNDATEAEAAEQHTPRKPAALLRKGHRLVAVWATPGVTIDADGLARKALAMATTKEVQTLEQYKAAFR